MEVSGGSFLAIVCNGGEGGTVYYSIWLLIEEAGVDGFVIFWRGLPCACVLFVCEVGCGCGMVMWFALRREVEDFAMWSVLEGICMVKIVGV